MGTRRKWERQQDLWMAASEVVRTAGNAFYDQLDQILDGRADFQESDHRFQLKSINDFSLGDHHRSEATLACTDSPVK